MSTPPLASRVQSQPLGGLPKESSTKVGRAKKESKRDFRVITTSIESCFQWHRKYDCDPALLLFKTYGILVSGPESPDRELMRSKGLENFVMFELRDRRSELNLSCYFIEAERSLPEVRIGQTYTVVGHFQKEEGIGEFKALTINEATPDNGIRHNLYHYNEHKLKKMFNP